MISRLGADRISQCMARMSGRNSSSPKGPAPRISRWEAAGTTIVLRSGDVFIARLRPSGTTHRSVGCFGEHGTLVRYARQVLLPTVIPPGERARVARRNEQLQLVLQPKFANEGEYGSAAGRDCFPWRTSGRSSAKAMDMVIIQSCPKSRSPSARTPSFPDSNLPTRLLG